MEEFSGTTAQLDFGRSTSLGSNPAIQIRSNATTTPGLRYKNLGKSGLRVSNVGLGTWPIFSPGVSEEQAESILRLAVDSGINLFDLSEAHSGTRAEIELGKIIQKAGWKRTSFVIITKIYWSTKSEERGLSRKHIIESVQASLQRLQLPYIDVILVHKADSMCPMEEIVRAMNYVISQGWSMYWGTARWSPVEIMEAYTNCRQFNCVTPIVEQSEYHMFCREKAELYLPEMYNKIGVGFMAWGPLSMCLGDAQNGDKLWIPKGSLKSKSQSYSWIEDEVNKEDEARRLYDKARDISCLAEKLGCNAVQLSIAWSLKHEPVQCLLLGATSPEQLHQSLQALQLLPRLSTGVMLEIERILENKPVRPPPISTLALRITERGRHQHGVTDRSPSLTHHETHCNSSMQPLPSHHQLRRVTSSSGHRAQGMQKQSKSCHLPATPLSGKQWRHHHQHRSVLPTSLLRLESLNVSLESLLFDQAGLDSKFNNSTSATGTIHSTDTTVSTMSCAGGAGDKQHARQLVDCLKSIDTTMLKERKFRRVPSPASVDEKSAIVVGPSQEGSVPFTVIRGANLCQKLLNVHIHGHLYGQKDLLPHFILRHPVYGKLSGISILKQRLRHRSISYFAPYYQMSGLSLWIKRFPVVRGMITYSCLWPTGCFIQQKLSGKKLNEIDWNKCWRFFFYGGFIVAPTLYGWIRLASIMWPRQDLKSAIAKALTEQISYTPMAMTAFYFSMSLLESKTFEEACNEVKVKLWPTYKVALCIWPLIQTFNFSIVPEKNRVPFVRYYLTSVHQRNDLLRTNLLH
ncbi:hypothetical protein AND_005161 [Anopheles darlingi]|uniref:NADP-dependent oxidoreductase domain-containing protein n=1 Tax=Anopheles darlingi TaxID=43151 RepID=W5JIL4_ANODA|nr:hypothetical protein AND_005161 [Anopheles darlingi]